MKFCKKTLSFILAFVLLFSSITPVSAKNDTVPKKTTIKGQEVIIGDTAYYVFSTDKNAKSDLIKAHEKGKLQLEKLQGADGLEISGELNGASVGAGETEKAIPYYLNIKGSNFIGVGGKSFDWDTLPDGLELQVWYLNEDGIDVNIGSPITINESNYQRTIHMTFDIVGQPLAFGMKTNVDSETYLTDVYYTNENSPEPSTTASNDMTFDLVQVPSTNLSVKWVDVNRQQLARENTPATVLKDILTFNFIENRKFDLPNQDRDELYFRLINKVKRVEVKDMQGATALVSGKKDGEEVTLDGKIYKLTTSYDPAFNKGSKIQLMYMPDVIDRTKNPESPTPTNYVRVTIDAGEGTKLAQGETKKVYDVRVGKALKAEHYPKLELLPGHKDPITWTIAPGTAITRAENIKGNAAKTAAETITAANLKAVDTTALQGQDFPEKFWNDGVALADNIPADKKDAFAALLKDATVTDITNPVRTTAEAGDKVGTLLVTFKDGSTLEVPNQKLIVKPNTVKVELDKDAQGAEKPLRDGDTTVKGKISASSNSEKFPVNLDGALVTIKKGDTVLSRTLANADGSFVAGVKDPLVAGENISVVVTLPESKTESAPVTKTVQLNPDKLNSIIPTGEAVVKNLEGKKGVDQTKVATLKAAIQKAYKDLVDKAPKDKKQEDQKAKSKVTVDKDGQKSLDNQYEVIKKAIEALTGNNLPYIEGPAYKEIIKGDELDFDKVVVDVKREEGTDYNDYVVLHDDDNTESKIDLKEQKGKYYTITVEKQDDKTPTTWTTITDTTTIKQTPGTYKVTYSVEDSFGEKASHTMTLVVKKDVIEVPGEFPEKTPDGYVKVEFKSGDHAGLKGISKYLVKKDSLKNDVLGTTVKEPTIVPEEGWKVLDSKWDPALYTSTNEEDKAKEKFSKDFATTAQVLEKVKTTKPEDKDKDKYATVEFKADDAAHAADPRGKFEKVDGLEQTTKFWVLKKEPVTFNAPTVTEKENYKFTGWDNKVQASYEADKTHTATYKAKVVTKDPKDTTNYAKLTFVAGDHGKFEANAQTEIWVLKNEEVKFNAPTPTADKDFTFAKWDPEIQKSYSEDKTHTAKYTSDKNVSDVPVEGFQEVKFVSGNDGNFGKDNEEKLITEKSVWVKPDTLVDLRSKAPTVIVTAEKKSFVGWDKDLVGEFKLETENNNPKATLINAEYDSTVKTEKPTKHADKFAKVDFLAGNLGTIENNQPTTFWVVKGQKVTDTFKAPTVTAKQGWKVKADKAAWSPEVATKYSKDTIHLAQYDYTGASVVPQKPGDEKPLVPDNFVKVEFKKGDHGVISSEETFIYWVDPTKPVTADFKAPKVIADTNYKHIGWNPALTENQTFAKATDIVAQYKSTVLTEDPNDANYVTVEFNAKDHGTLTGDAKFWVYKNEKVSITAPTVTAKNGYTFNKWDPAVKDSYAEATVHNATYTTNNNVSDTEVEGFNKVTFKPGDHGTLTEKSVWVKPDTVVDLNDKAPAVTPEKGYSHIGWKPALIGKFENNTDIVAQYNEEKTPEPTVTARNIGTKGQDGKRVPATKTTVEIETVPKAKVTIEYTDKDGHPQKIENLTAGEDGKLTQEIQPKLNDGTDVKVTVQDGEKKPAEKTVKVFDDLDDNKIPDNQAGQTERPAALASNIGKKPTFTTITGEAEKGATVTAKVGNVVVGTATADKTTGKYTIQAKQNNAPIKEGVKIDVTATLAPKTESLKQTVVVFNDTDGTGQPDSSKDFDVKKAKEMQVVASPDKMVYSDGDKLNLDGLKVLVTDVNGNQKIFTYKHDANTEFTKAGLSVDLKQETVLSSKDYNAQTAKDGHNGRKLVVTLDTTGNTQVTEAITGETPTALTVNKNQSAQPTDVVAANQTDEKATKVKGKAVKDAVIKITDANGNNLLPEGKTVKADANGDFTADLNKLLDPGAKVIVTATEPGKTESPKAETTVIRDKDGNWKADTGSKLSTPVIDPIRENDEKVVVAAPKADDKIQTIEVSDQNGKTVTLTKDPADKTGKTWKVDGSNETVKENNEGKLEIPVKDKLPLNDRDQIKVTFKDGETPANEAFDKAPVQKASQTPKVDQVYTGDKSVKIVDPTVADPTAKTIKVKAGDNDSMTVEKQPDGSWKVKEDQNKEVKVEDGKIVVPLDPSAKKDELIKVSTINDSGTASPAKEVTVIDKEKLDPPTINPIKTGEKTVSGTALTNKDKPNQFAASTVDIFIKDGNDYKLLKEGVGVNSDGTYNYTGTTPFKDGDVIKVVANKEGWTSSAAETTVGVDTTALDKAIQDGKDALDKTNDGTPEDKALEKAIKDAENLKKRTDPKPPTQDELDNAQKEIEKAIENKKKTDEERQKLKDIIKEAEEETKKEGYKDKPGKDRRELEKAIKEGKENLKNNTNITESTTKIEKALEKIRKESILVSIRDPKVGDQSITITTYPSLCEVEVFINDISKGKIKTNGFGTYSFTLDEPIKSGTTIEVKAHKDGYNDDSSWIKVK